MRSLNNQIYYFEIAQGTWQGQFEFSITDFHEFRRGVLSLANRVLALANHVINKVFGSSVITSSIHAFPQEGAAGISRSRVWVRKYGIVVYRMKGEYILDPDGTRVKVRIWEQFGPIPFLLRNTKKVVAEIGEAGMSSIYHMPLLGGTWVGRYTVSPDRNHLVAIYESAWGRAKETISRIT
jgi:glycine/D-amino acid oxidase-like deaminating enzyme